MTTVEYSYDCCQRTIALPTTIPEDGSMLHHATAVDSLGIIADAMHDAQCAVRPIETVEA